MVSADVVASAAQLQQKTNAYLNQGVALCDLIASKLDSIVTLIDGDLFSGEEKDLGRFFVAKVFVISQHNHDLLFKSLYFSR